MAEYKIQNNSVVRIDTPSEAQGKEVAVSNKNTMQTFSNETLGNIRTALNGSEPMFCLSDIAKVLEHSNPARIKEWLDDEFGNGITKSYTIIDALNREQKATFITEPQLYYVLARTNAPKAKPFRMWVNSEVLPTIRKTGSYSLTQQLPQNYLEALEALIVKEKERLALEQKLEKVTPLVEFAENIAVSTNSKTIGDFAKILCNNEHIRIGEKRLFAWLRNHGYLQSNNAPYQKFIDCGYFEVKEGSYNVPKGIRTYMQTLITGKGQIYFADKLIKEFGYDTRKTTTK